MRGTGMLLGEAKGALQHLGLGKAAENHGAVEGLVDWNELHGLLEGRQRRLEFAGSAPVLADPLPNSTGQQRLLAFVDARQGCQRIVPGASRPAGRERGFRGATLEVQQQSIPIRLFLTCGNDRGQQLQRRFEVAEGNLCRVERVGGLGRVEGTAKRAGRLEASQPVALRLAG